jgi:hypothetical protein
MLLNLEGMTANRRASFAFPRNSSIRTVSKVRMGSPISQAKKRVLRIILNAFRLRSIEPTPHPERGMHRQASSDPQEAAYSA